MTKPTLADFAAAMQAGAPFLRTDIRAFSDSHPDILRMFADYDPFKLAATFGGLLAAPEVQSNCVRLEALCHLALIGAHGRRKPSAKLIMRGFRALGDGPVGRLEDPAEDVFVTSSLPRTAISACWRVYGNQPDFIFSASLT